MRAIIPATGNALIGTLKATSIVSVRYDALHVAGTRYLGQVSVTTVGFVTAKKSPIAKAPQDAVNELISTGAYARILAKWGVTSSGVTIPS